MSNVIHVDFRTGRLPSPLPQALAVSTDTPRFCLSRSPAAIDSGLRGSVGRMRRASEEMDHAMAALRAALSDLKLDALMGQARNLAAAATHPGAA